MGKKCFTYSISHYGKPKDGSGIITNPKEKKIKGKLIDVVHNLNIEMKRNRFQSKEPTKEHHEGI